MPDGCSVDTQAFSVLFLRAVVQPPFCSVLCTKPLWSLELPTVDEVREMPYLPRDTHADPTGVCVLSNTASLHSTAIVESVAVRLRACSS